MAEINSFIVNTLPLAGSTTAGQALLTSASAAAQRTVLGLGSAATQASTAFAAPDDITTAIATAQASALPQFEKNTTGALALTRATHQGADIILSVSGATFSFSATTQGNGFTFNVRNRTGSPLTVPTFAGATNEYALGAAHTQIKSAGNASITVYTRNSTMYVEILGDTQ